MGKMTRYSPEVRERADRPMFECEDEHASQSEQNDDYNLYITVRER